MAARIIDGKNLAERLLQAAQKKIEDEGLRPGLGVLLVGDDPASRIYVRKKGEAAERIGVKFVLRELPADTTDETVLNELEELNRRDDIHGIVIQLPLPPQLDTNRIVRALDPSKDVDGFHPNLLQQLEKGTAKRLPGLIEGIKKLFEETGQSLPGQHVTIVSNGDVFSRPLAACLRQDGAETETVGSADPELTAAVGRADLLVTAVGRPNLISGKQLKSNVVVIDVGTTRVGHRVIGDVDFDSAHQIASWITPVPGGVGPVTVAMLLTNVVRLASRQPPSP